MRIWHQKLIPLLCRQHLLAVWREGLGCYSIVTNNKIGYSHHPATLEFIKSPLALYRRMEVIRNEMLRRGYHPKELPPRPAIRSYQAKPWQSLNEQVERLKSKHCQCKIYE